MLPALVMAWEAAALPLGSLDTILRTCHLRKLKRRHCTAAGRPPHAAVGCLARLVCQLDIQNGSSRQLLLDGPSGTSMATLALTYHHSLSDKVVQLQLPVMTAATGAAIIQHYNALLQGLLVPWNTSSAFLGCVAPWFMPDSIEATAAAAVAATLSLLRIQPRIAQPWLFLEPAVLAVLHVVRPLLTSSPPPSAAVPQSGLMASSQQQAQRKGQQQQERVLRQLHQSKRQPGRRQPQHHHQQQQQQTSPPAGPVWEGEPVLCIEAAAVSCAAMCATLYGRWRVQLLNGLAAPEVVQRASVEDLARLSRCLSSTAAFVGTLVPRIPPGSHCREQPPVEPLLAVA